MQQTTTAKLPALFQNTVRAPRVNETKLPLESAFIGDISALIGEKESKYHKRSLFCSFPMKRDLSLSP